jgi:hypothetical protein
MKYYTMKNTMKIYDRGGGTVNLINIPKEWILSRRVLTGLEVNANYRSNLFANSYLLL